MRNFKTILLTFLLSAGIFSTVVFTACTKVDCANVVCQNGGTCSNGTCSCPTGYSGTFCETAATTAVVYKNNTYTPISVTINSVAKTIPAGGSLAVAGKFGTNAFGGAQTSGGAELATILDNGMLGALLNWNLDDPFPTKDTTYVPLNVGSTYFHLRLINKTNVDIINYHVNYQFPYGELYGDVTIPHDGKTYDMGYYLAYPGSTVRCGFSTRAAFLKDISGSFTNTTNQDVLVTVE